MSETTALAVGPAPAPGPKKHYLPNGVALDQNGVVHIVDASEGMMLGHQRRMHPQLELIQGLVGNGAGVTAGDRQQLNHKSQAFGIGNVGSADVANALTKHIGQFDAAPKGQRCQNGDFVGGIHPIDIGGGVRFGIAQLLRIGENGLKIAPLCLHPREDIVGGAVHNARDRVDAVHPQSLL